MLNIHQIQIPGYEKVFRATNSEINFDSYIAVHSTVLGPALGGLRIKTYESDDAAIQDVLRLAEGMTYKNSIAGLNLGGGKAVINLHGSPKTQEILEEFAVFVNFFSGDYLTAEDVGSSIDDLKTVRSKSKFAMSLSGAGDPSPMTAFGIFRAMEATRSNLARLKVSVQGLGKVGSHLVHLLHDAGVELTVSDINVDATIQFKNKSNIFIIDNSIIHKVPADIFAPCALGGSIDEKFIKEARMVQAIVGSANNQLSSPEIGKLLRKEHFQYAPDFVVNAGGVIAIAGEIGKEYNETDVRKEVSKIYDRIVEIYRVSEETKQSTQDVAIEMAKQRILDS